MLTSATDYYRNQQRVTALAVRAARQSAPRGLVAVSARIGAYQAAAALLAESAASDMLAEQGIPDQPAGRLNPAAFTTGRATASMLANTGSETAFAQLAATLVQDAGRTGMSVAIGARPNVQGHVRYLNPPSCSRCAVLAGRFYRYSDGFQRHPLCDCQMVPTNEKPARDLVRDPMQAFEGGQIRGLSKADSEAIRSGADIGQVVNVRRKSAGLVTGSSVMVRSGRLTPSGIFQLASDRTEAITLLRRYRYIT